VGGTVEEYEKMPFEVAPFLVYLTRQSSTSSPDASSTAMKADATMEPGKP
jgi:hypothetical protein